MIKVFVNGFGTIGKRIAAAVLKQDDMSLVGVAKKKPDFKACIANKFGIPLYVFSEKDIEVFEEKGIKVKGTIDDALKECDIVVDAAPKKVGMENKKIYEKFDKKAIFQGGEKASIADVSFTAQVNYRAALGKKYVRVVSCNTTALARIINEIMRIAKIKRIRGTLVRRAADPWEVKKGPINAIVPTFSVPSHHAKDVKTVLGDINISTYAVVVPTTIMHMHVLNVEFENNVNEGDIISSLEDARRIIITPSDMGLDSTATIMELARDLGRERNDMYEVVIFREGIKVIDKELWLSYAVHQEAIVVPENIDAIRAMFEVYKEPEKSIEKTDKSLGILRRL